MTALRCLITAGPTREHLDPVRYLSNGSSGKMGYAVAQAASDRGWTVDLVSGPVSLRAPLGVRLHSVVSAEEMFAVSERLFSTADVFIAVAAVADYRPSAISQSKIKKDDSSLTLELVPTIDILRTLAQRRVASQVIVGFAAETDDVEKYARKKLLQKRLDWIVANDVGRPGIGMNAENNAVLVLGKDGQRYEFGPAPKSDVAKFIVGCIAPID